MYKVRAKVSWTDSNGEVKFKVNNADVINQSLLTDDVQAVKWGKIVMSGLKAYYTKKAYTIRVSVINDTDDSLFDETFQHQDDDVLTW